MKILSLLTGFTGKSKRIAKKSLADYKQDILIRSGREQFEKLLQKGLSVPVALL